MGCFLCNFGNGKRFCRFCNCMREHINDDVPTKTFVLRNKEAYDSQVAAVVPDPSLSTVYGINHNSCLIVLDHFHVADGLPPDIAHDSFEDFTVDIVIETIVHFVQEKILTLDVLNDRINSFRYCEVDKCNKPQPVKIRPLTKFSITNCLRDVEFVEIITIDHW